MVKHIVTRHDPIYCCGVLEIEVATSNRTENNFIFFVIIIIIMLIQNCYILITGSPE